MDENYSYGKELIGEIDNNIKMLDDQHKNI